MSCTNVASKCPAVNTFMEEVMLAWLKAQMKPPDNKMDIMNQLLWLNSNILIDGSPLIWE